MNSAGGNTLRQLQLQLHAKLRDLGSNRAEERFRQMTTEELRSLLHRKVLRTDLMIEAYDGSSRAGMVQGALTEAKSEILGDPQASLDLNDLSQYGPRSIKSEANGGRSVPEFVMMATANGGVVDNVGGVKSGAVGNSSRSWEEPTQFRDLVLDRPDLRRTTAI